MAGGAGRSVDRPRERRRDPAGLNRSWNLKNILAAGAAANPEFGGDPGLSPERDIGSRRAIGLPTLAGRSDRPFRASRRRERAARGSLLRPIMDRRRRPSGPGSLRPGSALVLALVIACQGTPPPRSAPSAVVPVPTVACAIECARDLRDAVAAGPPSVRRDPQDRLDVAVALQNRSGDELQVLARVHFLDRNSNPNADATSVRRISIGPGATHALVATSRTADADRVRVRIWSAAPAGAARGQR